MIRPKPRYTFRLFGWTILIYRWRVEDWDVNVWKEILVMVVCSLGVVLLGSAVVVAVMVMSRPETAPGQAWMTVLPYAIAVFFLIPFAAFCFGRYEDLP